MNLTTEEIIENRERFLSLLIEAFQIRGQNTDDLITYLDSTDIFSCPASTKYHGATKGGLCKHCLNVYDNLNMLVEMKGYSDIIPRDSIIIASLLHDMAKVNFYELYSKNVKTYCDGGDKWDSMGKFKWETVWAYKVREEGKFVYGNHEETSEYLANKLIPLTKEESMAIIKHHAGMSYDSTPEGISEVYNACPLACLLHLADTLATFCDESTVE